MIMVMNTVETGAPEMGMGYKHADKFELSALLFCLASFVGFIVLSIVAIQS